MIHKTILSLALLTSLACAEEAISLHECCRSGQKSGVESMIANKADLNLKDPETGNTPLMEAAREFDVEIVRLLAAHDADVNLCNTCGNNALIEAFSTGQACSDAECTDKAALNEIVTLLIEKGIDLSHENNNGDTALSLAEKNGYSDALEVIKKSQE